MSFSGCSDWDTSPEGSVSLSLIVHCLYKATMTSEWAIKTVAKDRALCCPWSFTGSSTLFLANHNGFLQDIYQRRPLPVKKRSIVLSKSQKHNVIFPLPQKRGIRKFLGLFCPPLFLDAVGALVKRQGLSFLLKVANSLMHWVDELGVCWCVASCKEQSVLGCFRIGSPQSIFAGLGTEYWGFSTRKYRPEC